MADGAYTHNRKDGSEIELPKLSPSDFVTLGKILKKGAKAALRENITVLSPIEQVRMLGEFDARKIKYADVVNFLNTLDGQFAALLLVLQKTKPDASAADVDALGIPAEDWLTPVAGIADLTLGPPKNAGSASPTGTGATTQIPSTTT